MKQAPVLQPGTVSIRHVKKGVATDLGAVKVGGAHQVPQPENALEGWVSGAADLRLGEEGGLTLTLPNSTGGDGKLHRERFLIIENGRRAEARDLTGKVYYAAGGYRPGDEWLEVTLDDDQEEPLIVATPIRCKVTRQTVEIQAVDGLFLLKRAREFEAGFWCNAPRDVFDHYTGTWQVKAAALLNGTYAYDPSVPQSDGAVTWLNGTGGINGGIVLKPISTPSSLEASVALDMPAFALQRCWRAEVEYSLDSAPEALVLELRVNGTQVTLVPQSDTVNRALLMSSMAEYDADRVEVETRRPLDLGRHRLVVEQRDRWVFFYFDGSLVDVLPSPEPIGFDDVFYLKASNTSTTGKRPLLTVYSMLFRQVEPLLMRGTDRGDLRLPGAPTPGGLVGSYYGCADLIKSQPTRYSQMALGPTRTVGARRLDPAMNLGGTNWQPPGMPSKGFAARWVGAVYLDLADENYYLRARKQDATSGDLYRVFVGRTRKGEHVLQLDSTSSYDAPSGFLRQQLGAKNGWYPIIIEGTFANPSFLAVGIVRGAPAPIVYAPAPLGASHFIWAQGVSLPRQMWSLDGDTGSVSEISGGGLGITSQVATVLTAFGEGPTAGNKGTVFNGTSSYVEINEASYAPLASSSNITGALTLEAWIRPTTLAAGGGNIIRRYNPNGESWALRRVGSTLSMFIFNQAGTIKDCATADDALKASEWQLVQGVFNPVTQTITLYVNGSQVAQLTGVGTGIISRSGYSRITIGATYTGSWSEWFTGAIANAGFYARALPSSEIADHWAARQTQGPFAGQLAPQGIYEEQVRYESHYDMLKTLGDQFALQYRCRPRTLESGKFPGEVIPRIREGQDHNYRLDDIEARDIGVDLTAEETVDALLVDAAGIADPNSGAQITAEAINWDELGQHTMLHQDYESISDISIEAAAIQRAQSLLALKAGVAEEVAAMPRGFQERVDDFPVTGDAGKKLLRWLPGDAVLLDLDDIALADRSPRQMPAITKPFVPAGLQAPTVSWRQRTRNLAELLRRLKRQPLVQGRNYQRQLTTAQGSRGGDYGAVDAYSRIGAPADPSTLVRAELVVEAKSDASTRTIEVNGTNRTTFDSVGRYDITPFLGSGPGQQFVRATGGTGGCSYYIELLLAI